MSRVASYRARRRAELVEAIRACEAVLKSTKLSADYKRAFDAMQRAGERYDKTRHEEDDPSWDLDLSFFFGAEPDDVATAIDDATSSAIDSLREAREKLK